MPAETTNPAKIAKLDHEGAEGRGQVTSASSNVSPPAATFNGSPPATTSNISPSIIIPIVDQPRNENRGNDDRSRDRGNVSFKYFVIPKICFKAVLVKSMISTSFKLMLFIFFNL